MGQGGTRASTHRWKVLLRSKRLMTALMMTASYMVDHERSGGRNVVQLISRLDRNESHPNLDVSRRLCSGLGRGTT